MCRAVGKHGKKRSFRLKEATANERIDNGNASATLIWRNDATRCLVDAAAARFSRIIDVHRLLDVGCVSGHALFFRKLRVAVLFAGNFRQLAAQLVRPKTNLVAKLALIFASTFNSLGARRIPSDLLLLSWR